MMSVRCRGLTASDRIGALLPGLLLAALSNIISRKSLSLFFERTLLYDQREIPPFFNMNGFPIRKVPLTDKNFRKALLASGSIPVAMSRVTDIPGARKGTYRDGGVIDYHMDIPFMKDSDGIVLFPHYTNRVIPGWFDKKLLWRKPDPSNMENVLLLHPSAEFIKRLPYGKIPDRNDFRLFNGRDNERMDYWNRAIKESERLGEEFLDAVQDRKNPRAGKAHAGVKGTKTGFPIPDQSRGQSGMTSVAWGLCAPQRGHITLTTVLLPEMSAL